MISIIFKLQSYAFPYHSFFKTYFYVVYFLMTHRLQKSKINTYLISL